MGSLKRLDEDETLLVQSGKPVGVFRTHADAPRVLIANSNLVPHWATWAHFNELDRKGLAMYGQMTAGSWIYIGSQGIVQGTYETFVVVGRYKISKRFDQDISALLGAFRFRIRRGRVTAARIAYGGMAVTPKRAPATERSVAGRRLRNPTCGRRAAPPGGPRDLHLSGRINGEGSAAEPHRYRHRNGLHAKWRRAALCLA